MVQVMIAPRTSPNNWVIRRSLISSSQPRRLAIRWDWLYPQTEGTSVTPVTFWSNKGSCPSARPNRTPTVRPARPPWRHSRRLGAPKIWRSEDLALRRSGGGGDPKLPHGGPPRPAVPLIAPVSPRRRGPGCISPRRNITAPAIEDFHDARKQGGSDHGVAFVREMDEVKGAIVQRDEFIVHDHLNRARLQPALHLRNVCRAPLRRDEETLIVAARLQDHDVGSIPHVFVDAAEHHPGRFEGHSGIGHLGIDALGSEQGLQLRGICAFVADIKAMGVAGADRDNAQRRRHGRYVCAHKCRERQ